ncbi:hypothetical protein D3C87_1555890 [compost metagenome]
MHSHVLTFINYNNCIIPCQTTNERCWSELNQLRCFHVIVGRRATEQLLHDVFIRLFIHSNLFFCGPWQEADVTCRHNGTNDDNAFLWLLRIQYRIHCHNKRQECLTSTRRTLSTNVLAIIKGFKHRCLVIITRLD